jgi:hypothetical protein
VPEQQIIALACLFDAFAWAADPTGGAMRRACEGLREGLAISDAMGGTSEAAEIIRGFLAQVDDVEMTLENNQIKIREIKDGPRR